jgi:glutathione peroxidase
MKSFWVYCCSLLWSFNVLIAQEDSQKMDMKPTFHELSTVTTLMGETLDLNELKGKYIVVLNVASECGYTKQYADWQKFYAESAGSVIVIGVPCNQFGGQEPGQSSEIATFCEKNYGVTFPILEKQDVKGDAVSPLYSWLTNPDQNGWNKAAPNWNFCKYLISPEGALLAFFDSEVLPSSSQFVEKLMH